MLFSFIADNRTGMATILVSAYAIFTALMIVFNIYLLKDHNVFAQSIPVLSASFNSSDFSNTNNTSNTHTLSVIGSATTNIKPDKVLLLL
jgi:hypothetical protein